MNSREIENILNDIEFLELTRKMYGEDSNQLFGLARAYEKLADLDQDQKKDSFQKAFDFLNKLISLDKDDYDPSYVAKRTDLLIKIHDSAGLANEIKNDGKLININDLLEQDKKLLENGIHKVKGFKLSTVKSALKNINIFFEKQNKIENTLNSPTLIHKTLQENVPQLSEIEQIRRENLALKTQVEQLKQQLLICLEENKMLCAQLQANTKDNEKQDQTSSDINLRNKL